VLAELCEYSDDLRRLSAVTWRGWFLLFETKFCLGLPKILRKIPFDLSVTGDSFLLFTFLPGRSWRCQPSNFNVLPIINFAVVVLVGYFKHLYF